MRMNISVPDGLKKRMDKVKDTNWSALACRAFESHLAEIAAGKEFRMSTDDVVVRLRASREKEESADSAAGRKAGVEWAQRRATAKQLEVLEKSQDPVHDWYFGVGSSAYSEAEQFYFLIAPDDKGDRSAACLFWDRELGDDALDKADAAFVQGFAEGAVEVWAEVSDKL